MNIFVHRASECLTDHLSHGDGLICFSLLGELARRGHPIYAYTNRNGVRQRPENMTIRVRRHRIPANSLGPWEHSWRANMWLWKLQRERTIDVVWRMHPYDSGCPSKPYTGGRPLVVGPLFYGWPEGCEGTTPACKPRLGVGIQPLVKPLARRGWMQTLHQASLVLCATDALADQVRRLTNGRVATLPVIVDPPPGLAAPRSIRKNAPKFVFVANLVANKRPLAFCRTIECLRLRGVRATGTIIGEGSQRLMLQQWCRSHDLDNAVKFLGQVPNDQIYRQMSLSDGLISTSFGEPYGRSIVEAMSVGVVPICHRSGGPADFISSGVDGILADELEPEAYANTIISHLNRRGHWRNISKGALEKAAQWRPQVVIDRLERELQNLIGNSKPLVAARRFDFSECRA